MTNRLTVLEDLASARDAGEAMVVAQLGQSLDGRIATPTGHSHYINGRAAIAFLHALRAGVDAVVVGAGTALADDPRLTVRHVDGPDPARVLIDRQRRAGTDLAMLKADGARRIVFGPPRDSDPDGVECVPVTPTGAIAPCDILSALAARGMRRVLVEGGAATVSQFLGEGSLHRLCILVGPIIIGSGPIGLNLPAIETLEGAHRPQVAIAELGDGDVLFDCRFKPA